MEKNRFTNTIFIISVLLVTFALGGLTKELLSNFDTFSAQEHIDRWYVVSSDPSFLMLGPEDRIETILTFINDGADYRPAQDLVHGLLTDAYADIYAVGFVDCQEECERAVDEIHLVYAMMDAQ